MTASQTAMRSCPVLMRNFPKGWVGPTAIEGLPTKIKQILSRFGQILQEPEVMRGATGVIVAKAIFADASMAQAAVQTLHGLDMRSAEEKAGGQPPAEDDRFSLQLWHQEKQDPPQAGERQRPEVATDDSAHNSTRKRPRLPEKKSQQGRHSASNTNDATEPAESCVCVRGFPPSWGEPQLRFIFVAHGGASVIRFVHDAEFGRAAFVELNDSSALGRAAAQLDNSRVGDGEVIEECTISCRHLLSATDRARQEEAEARAKREADMRARREAEAAEQAALDRRRRAAEAARAAAEAAHRQQQEREAQEASARAAHLAAEAAAEAQAAQAQAQQEAEAEQHRRREEAARVAKQQTEPVRRDDKDEKRHERKPSRGDRRGGGDDEKERERRRSRGDRRGGGDDEKERDRRRSRGDRRGGGDDGKERERRTSRGERHGKDHDRRRSRDRDRDRERRQRDGNSRERDRRREEERVKQRDVEKDKEKAEKANEAGRDRDKDRRHRDGASRERDRRRDKEKNKERVVEKDHEKAEPDKDAGRAHDIERAPAGNHEERLAPTKTAEPNEERPMDGADRWIKACQREDQIPNEQAEEPPQKSKAAPLDAAPANMEVDVEAPVEESTHAAGAESDINSAETEESDYDPFAEGADAKEEVKEEDAKEEADYDPFASEAGQSDARIKQEPPQGAQHDQTEPMPSTSVAEEEDPFAEAEEAALDDLIRLFRDAEETKAEAAAAAPQWTTPAAPAPPPVAAAAPWRTGAAWSPGPPAGMPQATATASRPSRPVDTGEEAPPKRAKPAAEYVFNPRTQRWEPKAAPAPAPQSQQRAAGKGYGGRQPPRPWNFGAEYSGGGGMGESRDPRRAAAGGYAQYQQQNSAPPAAPEDGDLRRHFKALNLAETAKPDEIKRQYRRLALECHPDKHPDDVEAATRRFQEIRAAYEAIRKGLRL